LHERGDREKVRRNAGQNAAEPAVKRSRSGQGGWIVAGEEFLEWRKLDLGFGRFFTKHVT
jgi:hypothetical protein